MKPVGWLGFAIALAVGCDALPYRVEWGRRGGSEAADSVSEPARTTDSSSTAASTSERLATWEALHADLGRRLSSRRHGDPLPLDKLANCQRGLTRLGEAFPEQQPAFERAEELYERLVQRGSAATPSWAARVLREIDREVSHALGSERP